MSILSALGTRPIQTSQPAAAAQTGGTAAGAQLATASGNTAARLPVVDAVAQSSDSVTISQQGLAARAAQTGGRTLDIAQQFVADVAKKLFGDAGNGATISYDSASLDTSEQAGASATHSENANSVTDSVAFGLSDSAHFIGKGHITTADGHSYEFEIDVQYEADIYASASTQTSKGAAGDAGSAASAAASSAATSAASTPSADATVQPRPALDAPDSLALTGKQLPTVKFPGSLADLFDLLGRALQLPSPANPNRTDNGADGNLTLRLQRLVNSAALLAPRAPSDPPTAASIAAASAAEATGIAAPATTSKAAVAEVAPKAIETAAAAASAPVDRSKALASSYGPPSSGSELATA